MAALKLTIAYSIASVSESRLARASLCSAFNCSRSDFNFSPMCLAGRFFIAGIIASEWGRFSFFKIRTVPKRMKPIPGLPANGGRAGIFDHLCVMSNPAVAVAIAVMRHPLS